MRKTGCPFCFPDESKVITKRKHVFVKLSDPRLMEGHLLIIPYCHIPSLDVLKGEERKELFETVIDYQARIKRAFGPNSGCDISQHERPFMPTTRFSVPEHLHFHLRPRFWKDELYQKVQKYETGMFQPLSSDERDRMLALLVE